MDTLGTICKIHIQVGIPSDKPAEAHEITFIKDVHGNSHSDN